ncbi:glycosyltransferase [Acinetobacter soli]|uniref:glycosyltransferase n=1 Tax=Acinetobacter soli TaxID=487316 RepID=UPI000CE2D522|nr:glycosyltransferase [Acinetobacter soli]PPB85795.1 hypothetical protein AsoHEU7_13015 [Acinetobacter soli]
MKLLHAAETIKGGVATVLNSLITYQTKVDKINEIVCLIPEDQLEFLENIKHIKVYTFKRKKRNLVSLINFSYMFVMILFKEKPDVLHLHSSFAGLIGRISTLLTSRIFFTRIIYCPHAFSFLMTTSKIKKIIYSFLEILLSYITYKIICVSESERIAAINIGINSKKLITIYNGVSIKNTKNTRDHNNKSYYNILFVGRFDFQKGIDVLFEAMNNLNEDREGIKYIFTIVGAPVNNDQEYQILKYENILVRELGWLNRDELEVQYINNDLIILPSRWEGFAMVPLEAMSYGLPILASDIEAFKEIIKHDHNGLLFKQSSVQDLVKLLKSINKKDLNKFKNNSLDIFIKKYTDEVMNTKTINLYFEK